MNRYKDYMDGVEASDTLHRRLTELEPPRKRPAAWKKYGAAAAALVLVVGVGAWGLGRMIENTATVSPEVPANGTVDMDREDIPMPDIIGIAPPNPNEPYALPDRTNGGYEVTDGEMTAYYFLPWLEWADASAYSQNSMDYQLAEPGAVSREITWDDVLLFTGGEKAMADHLLWDGLDWGGTVWFADEFTPCAAFLCAEENGLSFSLEIMLGYDIPSCVVLPEEYYETSRFHGTKITAVKGGGYAVIDGVEMNEKREISFYFNGAGYKLTLYTSDAGLADELCARFVRHAVYGGFHLYALSDEPIYEEDLPYEGGIPDKGFPPEDMPTANILHPGDEGYIEPFPEPAVEPDEDSVVMTTPYDPSAHN